MWEKGGKQQRAFHPREESLQGREEGGKNLSESGYI